MLAQLLAQRPILKDFANVIVDYLLHKHSGTTDNFRPLMQCSDSSARRILAAALKVLSKRRICKRMFIECTADGRRLWRYELKDRAAAVKFLSETN